MAAIHPVKSKCSHCNYTYSYLQGDILPSFCFVKCPKCKEGKLHIPKLEIIQFNLSPKTNFYRLKGIFTK